MPDQPAKICAVITSNTCAEARAALNRASATADIGELRLDYLADFDFTNSDSLATILEGRRIPVILTCRVVDEGGVREIDDSIRFPLLIDGAKRFADYCDIEASRYDKAARLQPDISRLIVSWHNFAETPVDLEDQYARITRLPAAVYKIATRANEVSDAISIFSLLERARSENRNLIALAMGPRGFMTRILGPSHGGFLTYGSIEEGGESAPGQVTIDELVSVFRLRTLTRSTAVAGVIGTPVGHSASPAIHNAAFSSLALDAVYLPIDVGDVKKFFIRFVRPETRELKWNPLGFSVTIPHKRQAMEMLDEIDETSRAAGAVNTVVIRDGKLLGYNTDVQGAMQPLEERISLSGRHCAVIGAGGSARAVVYGLIARGARVTLFVRDIPKTAEVADRFGVRVAPVEALVQSNAEIVINCTPVGMRRHSESESPVERIALRGRRLAYDLVYNPIQTRFLKEAEAEGCQTVSGIEMLVAQAAIQFQLWTGKSAPTELMRRAALDKLSALA